MGKVGRSEFMLLNSNIKLSTLQPNNWREREWGEALFFQEKEEKR